MPDDRSRWPHIADSADIEAWADRVIAPSEFPVLVRRLIQADNKELQSLEMPGYEGVNSPGFDGHVVSRKESIFVPEGISIWEVGISGEPRTKANDDFDSRTTDPRNCTPAETTFVFVTPRRWKNKDKWVAEKKKLEVWKDVKVIDVDNLLIALENLPGIHYWFSGTIGVHVDGIQTLDSWWEGVSQHSSFSLKIEDVLAQREDAATVLLQMMENSQPRIVARVKSVDDLLLFIAGAVMALPEERRADLLTRILIIKNISSLRQIEGSWSGLILIPFSEDLYRESTIVSRNSIILADQDARTPDVVVPPMSAKSLEKSLLADGIPSSEALSISRGAAKSLKSFLRLTSGISYNDSARSETLNDNKMRILWLLGAWHADQSADLDLVVNLVNLDWATIEDSLRADANDLDPIFSVAGNSWAVRDLADTGSLVMSKLTTNDLHALEKAVQISFGRVTFDQNKTGVSVWSSDLDQSPSSLSRQLKKGLAEVLAFLGANGERITLGNGQLLSSCISGYIGELLGRANKDLTGAIWQGSLEVLPLLAEAAPEVFLRELAEGLKSGGPLSGSLFKDSKSERSYSIASPHVYLLYALEALSWKPELLSRVVEILATLALEDPGGVLVNRPLNSMISILHVLRPQTAAAVARRISVCEEILTIHPEIGWKLLIGILPHDRGMLQFNHEPRFRNWKPEVQSPIDRSEYDEMLLFVRNRIITFVDTNPDYWPELIERIPSFLSTDLGVLLETLSSYASKETEEQNLFVIYSELTSLVRKHREFPDAKWTMDESSLTMIEEVAARFAPATASLRNRWLFAKQRPDLGSGDSEDETAYQAELNALRVTACNEIYSEEGLSGILKFASEVTFPFYVGSSFVQSGVEVKFDVISSYLDSPESSSVSFSAGFISSRQPSINEIIDVLDTVSERPALIARLLLQSAPLEKIWEFLSTQDAEVNRIYWSEFPIYGRGEDFAHVNVCSQNLLDQSQIVKAINLLSLYVGRKGQNVDADLAFEALRFFANRTERSEAIPHPSSWELGRLLGFLQIVKGATEEIVELEWKLLPDLGYGYKPLSIEERLAQNPEFFVQILSLVYRAKNEEERINVDPISRSNAFRALNEWSRIPGSSLNGLTIDQDFLAEWLAQSQDLLRKVDRLEVGENVIGQLLAKVSVIEGEAWPPESVCAILEAGASESLKRGFVNGVLNLRGVYSRNFEEGGAQEHALADKFESWKEQFGDRFPVTSDLLQQVADQYRAEARREDERLKNREEGFDED